MKWSNKLKEAFTVWYTLKVIRFIIALSMLSAAIDSGQSIYYIATAFFLYQTFFVHGCGNGVCTTNIKEDKNEQIQGNNI